MLNIGMESLTDTKTQTGENTVESFDLHEIYFDLYELSQISRESEAVCVEMNQIMTSIENLLAIKMHIEKFGSTEALIDLVGVEISNENAVIDGIKKAIAWLIEKLKAFGAWIKQGLEKLFGTNKKVETVVKVVEKIKEVPVEVIKEKEVIKTVEVAVEKPVYIEKDQKWKFNDDWPGRINKYWTIAGTLEHSVGSNGEMSDAIKKLIEDYKITPNTEKMWNEFAAPFMNKDTILTTSQIIPLVETCGKLSKISNRVLDDIVRGIAQQQKYLDSLAKRPLKDPKEQEEEIKAIRDDIWKLRCIANLAHRVGDASGHFCAYLTKDMFGESRLYTDK
jgi:hypothetical protein